MAVAMVRVHRHKSIDNLPAIRRKREGGIITSRACALYSCAVLQLSYLHREHPPAVLLACIAPSCCSSLEDSVSLYPSFNAAVVSNPHHCTLQPTLLFNPSYCIIPCKHRRTNQQTHMIKIILVHAIHDSTIPISLRPSYNYHPTPTAVDYYHVTENGSILVSQKKKKSPKITTTKLEQSPAVTASEATRNPESGH